MVTVMNVGYGDIVPVSPFARMLNAFLITPGKIFVWLIFIGTAYQFVYQQYIEERELKKLQKKLNNHIIICGYGMTGQAVVDELLNKKYDIEQLVVIDNNEEFIRYAADNNITALLGNASKENILKKAAIEKAQDELLNKKYDIDQLVVIENNEEFIRYAADNNITALLGNASKENILILPHYLAMQARRTYSKKLQ